MKKMSLWGCAAVAAVVLSVQSASAVPVYTTYSGNDCSGVFGQGFANCTVTHVDPGPDGVIDDKNDRTPDDIETTLSPIIAKYDNGPVYDKDGNLISAADVLTLNGTVFPSLLDGAVEFAVNEATKTWTYTAGATDPAIKYWVHKQSNGFTLFWDVLASDIGIGKACETYSSLSCMLVAQAGIISGSWTGDYSHLSWYDTRPPNQNTVVPIPAALPLLLGGMGGLAWLSRRQKRKGSAA